MITLPENTLTDLTGYIIGVFGDLWFLIALLIGIPLAFWVIDGIINASFSKGNELGYGEQKEKQ